MKLDITKIITLEESDDDDFDWEGAFFEDCRRADREEAEAAREDILQCHQIGYGGVIERPDYCERLTMTDDELKECTCCSKCCGCGG